MESGSTELVFLFEISVEEIKSFSHAKNHKIRARFGDVFTLQLKDPNEVVAAALVSRRNGRNKSKRALKIRNGRALSPNKLESSQIAVVVSDVESLTQSMLNFPIELTHFSKDEPFVLGVVEIPWTMHHIDYLKNLANNSDQPPVVLRGTYKTYDEYTSKRVAAIALTISFSQVKGNSDMSKQITDKNEVRNNNPPVDLDSPISMGTIRTIYSGGKLDGRRKKHNIQEKYLITQNKDINELDVVSNDNDTLSMETIRIISSGGKLNDRCKKSNIEENDLITQNKEINELDVVSNDNDTLSMGTIRTIYSGGKLNGRRKKHNIEEIDLITQNKDINELDVVSNDNDTLSMGTIRTIYSGGKLNGRRKKHNIEEIDLITQNKDIIELDLVSNDDNDALSSNIAEKCDEVFINESVNIPEMINTKEGDQLITQESTSIYGVKNNREYREIIEIEDDATHTQQMITSNNIGKVSRVSLVRSQHAILDRTVTSPISPISEINKRWSNTAIEVKKRLDTLNYIFGNIDGPFGNRVYCVEYFTVENDRSAGASSPEKASSAGSPLQSPTSSTTKIPDKTPTKTPDKSPSKTPDKISEPGTPKSIVGQKKYPMIICSKKCMFGGQKNPCFKNVNEIELPDKAPIISLTKCSENTCEYSQKAASLTDPFIDEIPILVDFGKSQTTKDCCTKDVKEVQIIQGMTANLIQDPCSCTCECTFGFITKTTYCNICGGFEVPGDEMKSTRGGAPFPCPIYHGWQGKGKKGLSKKSSATGDESDKNNPKGGKGNKKSIDSDKESVKSKKQKRKRDPRFKFNYGYKGIPPQIGHSQCFMPCTGDMRPVPKHMGWLWTANNIPGLKERPDWRPGAANKHVVRMLRMARFPDEVINKRRRKDTGKKKRPLKRPLLIVQKKDGEYNVTMETVKTYTKPRAVNQVPYEDKDPIKYTIGRTDEENAERKKRKERAQRRLEREQRAFLQSAFHDMCKEICLKTYQQALGQLPFAEDSWCPCYPLAPPPDRIDESHSCSCTDSTRSSGSMTDDDEWLIEFTPPSAFFDPTREIKKTPLSESATQYTHLDYRVKLHDKYGNPVPRFFTGPDGKQECSDLGGFWGPNKKWLEINVDGFIAPDGRWAPMNFIGPCGEYVDAEAGSFVTSNGVTLTVGVDGYVDINNKWHFYTKPKVLKDSKLQRNVEAWKKAGGCIKDQFSNNNVAKPKKQYEFKSERYQDHRHRNILSDATFSCFGDASPRTLSQMGIAGHGHDRRILLSTLEKLLKQGERVNFPYSRKKTNKHKKKPKHTEPGEMQTTFFPEKIKCKHRQASSKGIVAVNDRGHKTYFKLKESANPRAQQRLITLGEEGISLSSFHVPCFSSFINGEVARQQQLQHILQHNARVQNAGLQTAIRSMYTY